MRTTNPNESSNAKTLANDQDTVSTAVFMAVFEYNNGANGHSDVFNLLDIRDGYYFNS